MNVTVWAWVLTLVGLLAVILVDLWMVDRGEPHEFSLKQAGVWVAFYVTLAVLFGVLLLLVSGGQYSAQFFAGYLTDSDVVAMHRALVKLPGAAPRRES